MGRAVPRRHHSVFTDTDIDAAIDFDRPPELPPRAGVTYKVFQDPSGGRHDHFAQAIGHLDGDGVVVVDSIRGRAPPFDPASVTAELVALAREYHCTRIHSDNYAAEFHVGAVQRSGATHARSELSASDQYREGLPVFSRGLIRLPNQPRLIRELRLLERRVSRQGKDTICHPVNGSDDYANSVFGLIYLLTGRRQPMVISDTVLARSRQPAGSRAWPSSSARGPMISSRGRHITESDSLPLAMRDRHADLFRAPRSGAPVFMGRGDE